MPVEEKNYTFSSYSKQLLVGTPVTQTTTATPLTSFEHVTGQKAYELSNHLGNVLAVVSDARKPINGTGSLSGIVISYSAMVVSATDYSAFGAPMVGRTYSSTSYRYGFNGQEKDDEVNGSSGTSYTAEFWQYDARLGRRWNCDPIIKHNESSYAAFANNPIFLIDPSGADTLSVQKLTSHMGKMQSLKSTIEQRDRIIKDNVKNITELKSKIALLKIENNAGATLGHKALEPLYAINGGGIDMLEFKLYEFEVATNKLIDLRNEEAALYNLMLWDLNKSLQSAHAIVEIKPGVVNGQTGTLYKYHFKNNDELGYLYHNSGYSIVLDGVKYGFGGAPSFSNMFSFETIGLMSRIGQEFPTKDPELERIEETKKPPGPAAGSRSPSSPTPPSGSAPQAQPGPAGPRMPSMPNRPR